MSNRRTRRLNKPHFELTSEGKIRVPLTKNKYATIDARDLRRVIRHSWNYHIGGGNRQREYAESNIKVEGKWKRTLLHRFLLNAKQGELVDHKDGDGLNCTRENLRLASRGQNQHNSGSRKGTSQFKGVSWHRGMKKWHAQITVNRIYHNLGFFKDEEMAARAYDRAARELHGEFARINF